MIRTKILMCTLLIGMISCSTLNSSEYIPKAPVVLQVGRANAVALVGEVDEANMYELMLRTEYLIRTVPKEKPIYLIIDSRGGLVDSFKNYVKYVKSTGRSIHTITIKAYSSAAFLVQFLDKRYVVFNSKMMFHEVSTGIALAKFRTYVKPWFNKEVEELNRLEYNVSKRLGISLNEYQELTLNKEWWLVGANQALEANAADRMVILKCDEYIKALINDCIQINEEKKEDLSQ